MENVYEFLCARKSPYTQIFVHNKIEPPSCVRNNNAYMQQRNVIHTDTHALYEKFSPSRIEFEQRRSRIETSRTGQSHTHILVPSASIVLVVVESRVQLFTTPRCQCARVPPIHSLIQYIFLFGKSVSKSVRPVFSSFAQFIVVVVLSVCARARSIVCHHHYRHHHRHQKPL